MYAMVSEVSNVITSRAFWFNQDLEKVAQRSHENDLLHAWKRFLHNIGHTLTIEIVDTASPWNSRVDERQTKVTPIVKNLGLLRDGSLNFEKHVDSIIGKCYGSLKYLWFYKYTFCSPAWYSKRIAVHEDWKPKYWFFRVPIS